MDPTPLIVAGCVALAAGLFRGFAGFGAGMMMAPLLTLIYPPPVVVPALLALSLIGDVRLVPEVHKTVNVRRVLWVALPAFVGLPLGIYALKVLDAELIRRIVNVLVLILVAVLARGVHLKRADRPIVLVPAGVMGGVLNGVGGVGGPPVVLTFLSMDEPPEVTRANLIAYFFLANSGGLLMMAVAGVLTMDTAELLAVAVLPFFGGIHFGSKMFAKAGSASYRKVALIFLATVALIGLFWPG